MPETIDHKKIFTLSEVSISIKKTLADRYTSSFWVKAEMNKLNYYKHSGHCYPELVEKRDGKVFAQVRSHVWREDFVRINEQFQKLLHEPLRDGIKILFETRITYDPVHGLSLWIVDIDPTFTLGDIEREKQESITTLKQRDLFYLNKQLVLPRLPQRLAIISVESSKGYADFINVIEQNPWHYAYFIMLFPALLQGDKAVLDIQRQLERIRKVIHHFDAVAIIRGGGGDVGLSCYNHYGLAKTICEFPIPVITGIGHSTNETVCEMVAHYNAITPTKLAEFMLQQFHNVSVPLTQLQDQLLRITKEVLHEKQHDLHSLSQQVIQTTDRCQQSHRKDLLHAIRFVKEFSLFRIKEEQRIVLQKKQELQSGSLRLTKQEDQSIKQQKQNLLRAVPLIVKQQQQQIQQSEKHLELLKPEHVLRRGYSITRIAGKAVRSAEEVQAGNEIETSIFEGILKSIVISTHEKE